MSPEGERADPPGNEEAQRAPAVPGLDAVLDERQLEAMELVLFANEIMKSSVRSENVVTVPVYVGGRHCRAIMRLHVLREQRTIRELMETLAQVRAIEDLVKRQWDPRFMVLGMNQAPPPEHRRQWEGQLRRLVRSFIDRIEAEA